MLPDSILQKINFEFLMIDNELESIKELYHKITLEVPDAVELRALASSLHAFYNGIEKIFYIIHTHRRKSVTANGRWRASLLAEMGKDSVIHKPVISLEMKDNLEQYMAFRHYFRHAYGFTLDWELMKNLCRNLNQIYQQLKIEILNFITTES